MPRDATDAMLKAMDECSTEGYDERLYAGHAASVYMAAVDVAPAPPQRKPLTDEQFISMVDCDGICIDPQLAFAIKEMVERAHGISELTPKESCHKCNDLGYYDDGHENDDGSMSGGNYVECERCKS